METRSVYPDLLWAGNEHSLLVAMEAHDRIMAGSVGYARPDEEEVPYLLKVQGDIAVLAVKGSLVNRDSPYNRYYGVTSYADISRALIYAATKPEIKGILLDVDSGGGAVNGCADCGALIMTIDSQIKPVWSFSGGNMASAAYWQGVSARKVYSAQTSVLGSIGVMVTAMEYTELYKKMGIGVTVMRAGEFKALLNPHEKHSEKALAQMQGQLNAAYGVFAAHVSDRRHVTMDVFEQKMGQGREFFGIEAVAAGLSDGIESFDSVFSKFSAKLLDTERVTHSNSGQYTRGSQMTRNALTEQQIAAAQGGVILPDAAQAQADKLAADKAAADKLEADNKAAADKLAAETAAGGAKVTETEKGHDVLAFVQTQLTAAQAEVVQLKVDLKSSVDKLASEKAAQAGLVEIAAKSLNTMRIALGMSGLDATKLTAETLVAEHKGVSESFLKTFKAGGVAATGGDPAPEAAAKELANDPNRKARLAATRV